MDQLLRTSRVGERAAPAAKPSRAARTPKPPRPWSRPRVLLVAALFKLPYRVLRCLAATGADVVVLGRPAAHSLALSRFCHAFVAAQAPIDGRPRPELARQIDALVAAYGIDLVVPGDAPTTRSLLAIRDDIDVAAYPGPDLEAFDLLNDKWRFTQLCRDLGVSCPHSILVADVDELRAAIEAGAVALPAMAKPLSRDGGVGCVRLDARNYKRQLQQVFYRPILAQTFIEGADVSCNVYAAGGEVAAFVTQSYARSVYTAYHDPRVHADVARIVRRLELTGLYNFDLRQTTDGRLYYLECNPRVSFRLAMSMLAGVNVVAFGVPWANAAQAAPMSKVSLPFTKAILRSGLRPWTIESSTATVLKFLLDDPVPYLREAFGLERFH